MIQDNALSFIMKHKVGTSIKAEISNSGMSDIELSHKLGVSRSTIYLWRVKETSYIRKSNLVALSKLFNKDIKYNEGGIVEFTELSNIIKGDLNIGDLDLKANDTQKLITTLSETNSLLVDQLKEKNKRIHDLNDKIDELVKTNSHLATQTNAPTIELDHSRMQFIVDMFHQTFINMTQKYANVHNAKAFDLMRDVTFSDIIHPEDMWRLNVVQMLGNKHLEEHTAWKIKDSDKIVSCTSISLSDTWVKTDVEMTNESAWEKTNEFYKRHKRIFEQNIVKNKDSGTEAKT